MGTFWVNEDGLTTSFGTTATVKNIPGVVNTEGFGDVMVTEVDATTITTALPTNYENGAYIPAGALIESAQIVVSTAFDSAGGAATLSVSTYAEDGTVDTAGGIDSGVLEAALSAGAVIECDGSLIGTVVSENLYVGLIYGTEAFTAGEARLVIKYSK